MKRYLITLLCVNLFISPVHANVWRQLGIVMDTTCLLASVGYTWFAVSTMLCNQELYDAAVNIIDHSQIDKDVLELFAEQNPNFVNQAQDTWFQDGTFSVGSITFGAVATVYTLRNLMARVCCSGEREPQAERSGERAVLIQVGRASINGDQDNGDGIVDL